MCDYNRNYGGTRRQRWIQRPASSLPDSVIVNLLSLSEFSYLTYKTEMNNTSSQCCYDYLTRNMCKDPGSVPGLQLILLYIKLWMVSA